jgi:hypothetical protein
MDYSMRPCPDEFAMNFGIICVVEMSFCSLDVPAHVREIRDPAVQAFCIQLRDPAIPQHEVGSTLGKAQTGKHKRSHVRSTMRFLVCLW